MIMTRNVLKSLKKKKKISESQVKVKTVFIWTFKDPMKLLPFFSYSLFIKMTLEIINRKT